MSIITDNDIANKLIQPIRFFRNTYGDMIDKRNYKYYESSKNNVVHQIANVPILALIKFQLQFPAYYFNLSECKIYCPDRTTELFNIKTKVLDAASLNLIPYQDSEGLLITQFIYRPLSGFSSACPTGLGVIRVVATHILGTGAITWESDVINLFDTSVAMPGGTYPTEAVILDAELGM